MNNILTKKDIDALDISALSNDRKEIVESIKNKMDLTYENTLSFGNEASKNLSDFSTSLLKTIKLKDTPEVEDILTGLMGELRKVDSNSLLSSKPSFFKKVLRIDDLKAFISKYENVESIIVDVKNKLEEAQYHLKKDIELCDKYLDQNIIYINDLDNLLFAGKLKFNEEKAKIDEELLTLDKSDSLAVYTLNQKQAALNALDRKLYDLALIKENAVQNIPQISLIKEGNSALIEKIQTSVNTAIPLWERQIVLSIQLVRQKNGLDIQKAVTDTTNQLILMNAQLLKTGSVEIAREMQNGIIDIEVLKKSSQTLIETLSEIKKIRVEGESKRIKATEELTLLQGKLNEVLIIQQKDRL